MAPIRVVLLFCCMFLFTINSDSRAADQETWQDILARAQGQTVYFNGWGGSEVINAYIRWAGDQVRERYGVTVTHVKVSDIGDVVSRILAEKSAGRSSGGSVDLMWINGENFQAMKENGLLLEPYTQLLPNYGLVDTENKPSTLFDFTVPVEHQEAPWGMAQLVFLYDSEVVTSPPASMAELLAFCRQNPGRFTYPAPPDFYGTTFIKQALLELTGESEALYQPVETSSFEQVTAPLWEYLDTLHPQLWRSGKAQPSSAPEMKRLLNDKEIFISLSFNPAEASNAIATGELPESIRTYVHRGGTIGNTHFVAIPFNSSAWEGALVFADFLLSPEAQARKSDPSVWGDPTVLALAKLSPAERKRFEQVPQGIATLGPEELGSVLLEPHASWVDAIEKEWQRRYAR
ncbi:MAG: ABC transporter substrate-binding protein [Desulfocapsaceae bacterium]